MSNYTSVLLMLKRIKYCVFPFLILPMCTQDRTKLLKEFLLVCN